MARSKNKSDYNNSSRINLNNLLPEYIKTETLKTLNNNLVNRYLTKNESDHIVGLIGDEDTSDLSKFKIKENSDFRKKNQLQPVAHTKIGTINHYQTFLDFIKKLENQGIDTEAYNKFGDCLQFNWAPPIDFDKIINYQNYYWAPTSFYPDPDYIVIKNLATWAKSRLIQSQKTLYTIFDNFNIVSVDVLNNKLFFSNNITNKIFENEILILKNLVGDYIFAIVNNVVFNSATGKTEITIEVTNSGLLDPTFLHAIKTSLKITNLNDLQNSFVVSGNFASLLTNGYVLGLIVDDYVKLFTVKSSEFNLTTNSTLIYLNEQIDVLSYTNITFVPFNLMLEGEYAKNKNSDYIKNYFTEFNLTNVPQIFWTNEKIILNDKATGVNIFNSNAFSDTTVNFISSGIMAGDYLQILNGPNLGKYVITSVYTNSLNILTNEKFFDSDCKYRIIRDYSYTNLISETTPSSPINNQLWYKLSTDILYQWDGFNWVPKLGNVSKLFIISKNRHLDFKNYVNDWSNGNRWIHKDQINDFTDKTRAQLPIIEYSSYLELSQSSYAEQTWEYRSNNSETFRIIDGLNPLIFELVDIKLDGSSNFAFQFDAPDSIILNQRFGNLSNELIPGFKIKLSNFNVNNGIYEIISSEYIQLLPNERFVTRIKINTNIDPFDLPEYASITPVTTSNGDLWINSNVHWQLNNIQVYPSSINSEQNPMLNVYIGSAIDLTNDYQYHYGLNYQDYKLLNNSNMNAIFAFEPSLHDLVLYDNYQEGDIRIYVNGKRQYGNYTDIKSTINSNFIGGIQFVNTLITTKDRVRIELGEYNIDDIGRRSVDLTVYRKSASGAPDYNTGIKNKVNLVRFRKIEQQKIEGNQYPFFRIADINFDYKLFSNNVFKYREDPSYPINLSILKRIVVDSIKKDYTFVSELSNSETGELYCYKDLEDSTYRTIWKHGDNLEKFVPKKIGNDWDIPNQLFYNVHHENKNDIKLTELYRHFDTIMSNQTLMGIISSTGKSFYLDDDINYGLGGTIKEHNDGFDLLFSSTFVNNVNVTKLIDFAKNQYLFELKYIQDEFSNNIYNLLLEFNSENDITNISNKIAQELKSLFENNEKFDQWFGDSSTYDALSKKGMKNWIATLPYLMLTPKYSPYYVYDEKLKIYEVVHHDGHRGTYSLNAAFKEYVYKLVLSSTISANQIVENSSEQFPNTINGNPLSLGNYLLRTVLSDKSRKLYRFNVTGYWEEVDLNILLVNTILLVEQSLYDNLSDDLHPDNFVSKFNYQTINTDAKYDEYLQLQFSKYIKNNNIQNPYILSTSFNQNDPFTWNYFNTPVANHPVTGTTFNNTSASWQSLYQKIYNTPYPHIEPWKLQDYKEKPDWWDTEYKDYTNVRVWKGSMWNNILFGIVPVSKFTPYGTIGTGLAYQLPLTYSYLSVNIDAIDTTDGISPDSLLPPYWNSQNSANPYVKSLYDPNQNEFIVLPNANSKFGQDSYYEWLWKNSLEFYYDLITISYKIQPMRFVNQTFGTEFKIVDCLQVDSKTGKVFSHKDTEFHGDFSKNSNNVYTSNGMNQWLVHYNRYLGFDGLSSEFRSLWKEWDSKLSYVFGGLIDTESFYIFSKNFDIVDKDYALNIKKTYELEVKTLNSLIASIISIPSKYSSQRNDGIGWTVDFSSVSPNGAAIKYYAPQNYSFVMNQNSNIFKLNTYSLYNASIDYPNGYQIVNYNQKINLSTATNLQNNNFVYYATVLIDGTITKNLQIRGYKAQTIKKLIDEMNIQLGSNAYASIELGNIKITSNSINSSSSILITDSGLFATASNFYLNMFSPNSSSYKFNNYFELKGNLISIFDSSNKIIVSNSAQFNGIYTINQLVYDVDNTLTRIFVNENVNISSGNIDGLVEPEISQKLPDNWITGTEVFLNSIEDLPKQFNSKIPYYIIKINDREFKLAETPYKAENNISITPNEYSILDINVGKLRNTFKTNVGVNSFSWKKHEVDKNNIKTVNQSFTISGIQNIIDFVTGYDEYHHDLGFICKSPNAENNDPNTGRIVNWQFVLENFINYLYTIRSLRQENELIYAVSFNNIDNSVKLKTGTVNWETGTRVLLSFGENSELPEPFNNPLIQFVPYYVIRNYSDNTSFKLAFSSLDAAKGRAIDFQSTGSGDLYVHKSNSSAMIPQYELNPFQNYIWVEHDQGIMSDIFDGNKLINNTIQRIYDSSGNSLTNKDLIVLRNDGETRISLTLDIIEKNRNSLLLKNLKYMSGMELSFEGYEHILAFENYSFVSSLIYDPFLGLRTPRFYTEFDKQQNATLRPNVGGFFFDNDKLTQNLESLTTDMRYYYDSYTTIEQKNTTKKVRKTLGYDGPKDYMDDLNINPKTQFIFWRGMIQNKGTNFAVNAFTNQANFNETYVDEFWAYKLSTFGDSKEKNYIDMKLYPKDSVKKELRIEFTTPDETALDTTFETVKLTDNSRWWDQPDQLENMPGNSAFYFDSDVISVIRVNQSGNDIKIINNNFYFELPIIADAVVISYFDVQENAYKFLNNLIDFELINSRTIRFIKNTNKSETNFYIISDDSDKLDSIDKLASYTPDDLNNLTVSVIRYQYDAQNPARLIDKKSNTILTNVPIWNPVLGHYYNNAISIVDIRMDTDPATYTNRLSDNISSQNITIAPWAENKIGTIWFNTRNEGYIPYYDDKIFPNINDRIYYWGKTSDWNSIELLEWTESLVPPNQWDKLAAIDELDISIPLNQKRSGISKKVLYQNVSPNSPIPTWQELVDFHFEKTACLIQVNDQKPFGGNVHIYINGKFDMVLNLDSYSLYDYINPAVAIPGQVSKPTGKDIIRVIKRSPKEITKDILDNPLYKYETPYTVIQKFNKYTKQNYNVYYFWVSKKISKIKLSNFSISLKEAESMLQQMPLPYMILQGIRSPDFGYGLIYGNLFDEDSYELPLRYTKLIVKDLKGIVKDEDRYSLRFIRDFTLRDAMISQKKSANNKTPLYLKNQHTEWKLIRERQFNKIDKILWNNLTESLCGFAINNDGEFNYYAPKPALNRILFDQIYSTQTRFGMKKTQTFLDKSIGIDTLVKILTDPDKDYEYIDINQFFIDNNFNTPQSIKKAMNEIYENFAIANINNIFFELLNISLSTKYESPDFFKTSWVALDIQQNVTHSKNQNVELLSLEEDGICGIDIVVTPTPTYQPTPTPTPFPTPTMTTTPTVTPTVTPSVSTSVTPTVTSTSPITPSVTPTVTPTPTSESTPTPTATNTGTPDVTPTISVTPTDTVTPTVTPTLTVTNTATPSVTPTDTVTPTVTPTSESTPTPTATNTGTPDVTPTVTPTITITPTATPT